MKRMLLIVILLLLANCGQVSVKTYHEDGTPAWDISERTLGKNLTGVNAKVGDVQFSMDSASIEVQMFNAMMVSQQMLLKMLLETKTVVPTNE